MPVARRFAEFEGGEEGGHGMTGGELAYLSMVIGAMSIFALVLAYASFVAPGSKKS